MANIAKLPELLRRAEHGPVLMSAFGGIADIAKSAQPPQSRIGAFVTVITFWMSV